MPGGGAPVIDLEAVAEEAVDIGMQYAREKLGEELQAGIVKFPVDPILAIVHSAITDAIDHFKNRPIEVVAAEGVDVTIRIKD